MTKEKGSEGTSKKPLKIGMDLGTNTTVLALGEPEGAPPKLKYVLTVVGYPKEAILPGVLPGNRTRYFGEEAIKEHNYLDLKWPLAKGLVANVDVAKEFIAHVRTQIESGDRETWLVVGAPAHQERQDLQTLREALGKTFQRFLIVPEPFLAAIGCREDSRVDDPAYVDPARASMIVDIGAGTTDVCFLQGFFPTPEEQLSFAKAGNNVDLDLRQRILQKYPDANLKDVSITRIKEGHSYVGTAPDRITLRVMIHGKPEVLDITELVGRACEILVPEIVEAITELTKRCNAELVDKILGNTLLTGGGSLIRGLPEMIQAALHARGLKSAAVRQVPEYRPLVALGAWKIAQMAREDQWQHPTLS